MMQTQIGILVAALALLAIAPKPMNGIRSEGKAGIKGVVTSPAGGGVSQVKIIVFNLDTGVAQETKSDSKGRYEFAALPKGDFELTAIAEGYDLFGSHEIKVDGKRPVTYNIKLVKLFREPAQPAEDP